MDLTGKNVVIVNDDATQLHLTSALLGRRGMSVHSFSSAGDAFRWLSGGAAMPDVIITDVKMPGIDGWQFCRLLRSAGFPACNRVPILVVSAIFSGVDSEEISTEVGANAFLSIPFEPVQLFSVVTDLLEGRTPVVPERVLVLDSSAAPAKKLVKTFVERGFQVFPARDEAEARIVHQRHLPDYVVLPHLATGDGCERLLKEFKESEPRTVAIVISSEPDPALALRYIRAGADGFIRTPVEPEYLVEVCRKAKRERSLVRLERQLDERNFQLKMTQFAIEKAAVAVFWVGADGRIDSVNDEAEKLTGYSRDELLTMKVTQLGVDPNAGWEQWPSIWADLLKHRARRAETRCRRKSGKVFPAEIVTNYFEFEGREMSFGFMVDISDRKRAEEERLKMQRLESISVLAGGIGHDFNNMLMAIVGNLSLVKSEAQGESAEMMECVEEAEKAAMRARDLTRQLMSFAKEGSPIKQMVSLAEVIRESATFILRGGTSRCDLHIADDLWPANVDSGQIGQVIQNIVLNAGQAMPGGGVVTLTGSNMRVEEDSRPPIPAGLYIVVTIHDTGVGIPAKYLEKIFDPYFTTKQSGNGLGLAVTYSIVKKHGGYVTVESTVGVGTTFSVFLPAYPDAAVPSVVAEKFALLAGQGRVLILDDEAPIHYLLSKTLAKSGLETLCVKDGVEVIREYKAAMDEGRRFDVVLLDLTIPGGMGGKEAMVQLRQLDPEVKAIISSGHLNDPVMSDWKKQGFSAVMTKPYKLAELGSVIRGILAGDAK